MPVYCGISQSDQLGQLTASANNKPRARQVLYPSGLVIDIASCILTCRCVKGFSRDESAYSTFCTDLVVASGRTCSAADRYGSCFMAVHVCCMIANSLWNSEIRMQTWDAPCRRDFRRTSRIRATARLRNSNAKMATRPAYMYVKPLAIFRPDCDLSRF